MDLSRSDTYINVYIPREDGGDPRKFVPVNSPLFDQDKVYKFSEQVVKDRQLFLGKKRISLYELYCQTKLGKSDEGTKTKEDDNTKLSDNENEETEHKYISTRDPHAPGNNVNKLSLSLDSQVKKIRKLKRFNEPLNSYITNKKKAIMMKKLDAEDSVERQASTFDLLKEPTFYDSVQLPQTLYPRPERQPTIYGSRERQYTFYNTRQKTFYGTIYRTPPISKPKKSLSAVEARTLQNGLPPIYLGINKMQAAGADGNNSSTIKALPARPSSKPMKIYRQTTDILGGQTPRHSARLLAVQPPQQRTNVINLGQNSAF